MPSDDGLGFHENQSIAPSRPEAAKSDPEEAAERWHVSAWSLALENRELLAKRCILKDEVSSGPERGRDEGQ